MSRQWSRPSGLCWVRCRPARCWVDRRCPADAAGLRRRHVQQRRPRFQTSREQRDELARRFFAATQSGDLAGLEVLLAQGVVLTGDRGGKVPALARSLRGRCQVARTVLECVKRVTRVPGVSMRPVEVNAGSGALVLDGQNRLIGVWALEIAGGEIHAWVDRQPRQARAPRPYR